MWGEIHDKEALCFDVCAIVGFIEIPSGQHAGIGAVSVLGHEQERTLHAWFWFPCSCSQGGSVQCGSKQMVDSVSEQLGIELQSLHVDVCSSQHEVWCMLEYMPCQFCMSA